MGCSYQQDGFVIVSDNGNIIGIVMGWKGCISHIELVQG